MSDDAEQEPLTAELDTTVVADPEVGTFTDSIPVASAVPDEKTNEAAAVDDDAETVEDPDMVYIQADTDLSEQVDTAGHFRLFPPKTKKEYPSRSEALKMLKELHPGFNLATGFATFDHNETPLGEYTYYLAKDYASKLTTWVEQEDNAETEVDLTVDNSALMISGSETNIRKGNLDSFCEIISEKTWEQLIEWFGGGVRVRLKNVETVIHYRPMGKLIRCVSSKDSSKFRRFYFNSKETVKDMKEAISKAFGVEPEDCRLHDFFRHKAYARIDTEVSMKLALSKKQLLHNNLLFLEIRNDKGKFTIKYKKKKHLQYNPSAGLSNYSYYTGGAGYTSYFSRDDSISGMKGPPGIVGLNNLGNTCYMNSIIQCLSNTSLLKENFLSKQYEGDINLDNALGYKGEVARAFYKLMKFMWSGDGRVVRPAGFKKAINDAKTDFRGYQQHDSQEFLSELLDALHEDLNRIKAKPSTERVEARGRPDAEVAEESLATYKLRNDSIVTDLFTGLYKSTVTCPEVTCGNVSVTFDPYMIVPLPLQEGEKAYQVLQVIFVPLSPEQQPVHSEIIVPKHGPAYILRELLKESLGINDLNRAEREAKTNNTLAVSEDPNIKLALGYAEDDDDVVGNRDLLIFGYQLGKIGSKPIVNKGALSSLSKDDRLICFETFDYLTFEYYNYRPTESWKRELNFPRTQIPLPDTEETAAPSPEEKTEEKPPSIKSDGEVQDPLLDQGGPTEVDADVNVDPDGNEDVRNHIAGRARTGGIHGYPNIYGNDDDSDEEVEDQPRVVRPDATEAPDAEKIQVGLVGCPFLMGDVWHGQYNHNTDSQHLRIEILGVEKMDWSAYANYKEEIIQKYGEQNTDVKLTQDDFGSRDVFFIHAQADSKKVLASYMRYGGDKQSQFELKGVYITSNPFEEHVQLPQNIPVRVKHRVVPEEEAVGEERKSSRILSVLKKGSNLLKRKSRTDEEAEPDNLYVISNRLTPGALEKKYIAGSFVLRPTDQRSIVTVEQPRTRYGAGYTSAYTGYSGYSGYTGYNRQPYNGYYSTYGYGSAMGGGNQQDTSRDPIVLSGMIEKSSRYMWGKFQVDESYTKGEFTCQRFESMNWNNHKIARNPTMEEQPIMSWSKYPSTLDRDNRILVSLCHRMKSAGYRFPFGGIPDCFFVPAHITECEVMDMIKARYRIYFKKEIELEGSPFVEENPETGDPIDMVEERMKALVVKRSTDKFEIRSYTRYGTPGTGKEIDDQSDVLLNKTNDPFVWLVCEWNDYPLREGRPTGLFSRDNKEAKMTLHKALDLFSQVDKLSAMNTWYCNKCREHKEAYKQLQLWSVPKVLVIQFKRFSQEETRMRADKLEIPVDFPFNLDLTDYTLQSQVAGESMQADIDNTNAALSEYEYELVAVSSHIGGGLGSGHYVASAKNENDGRWYDFNDSSVRQIPEGDVSSIVNPQAYVLFYVRRTELAARQQVLQARAAAIPETPGAAGEEAEASTTAEVVDTTDTPADVVTSVVPEAEDL